MTTPTPSPDLVGPPWLVWSNEHNAFWRPNRCGYTRLIDQAGRYSKAEAEAICHAAQPRANSTIYEGEPPETCMPAPEALETQAAEIEGLRAELTRRERNENRNCINWGPCSQHDGFMAEGLTSLPAPPAPGMGDSHEG